eukprot:jgi/Undpi1/1966/HiC_scaffold_12.g05353.m1
MRKTRELGTAGEARRTEEAREAAEVERTRENAGRVGIVERAMEVRDVVEAAKTVLGWSRRTTFLLNL